jgi:hypothetical protein
MNTIVLHLLILSIKAAEGIKGRGNFKTTGEVFLG